MQAALDAKVADILSRASELREQFRKQGYLCFEALVPEEDCDALRARANELVEQFDPTTVRSVFTTGEKQSIQQTTDQYFLESGDKVRFFFEQYAWKNGELQVPKSRAINKIGHAMHDLDPVFRRFTHQRYLHEIATKVVGMKEPKLVQSMYIFKQPFIGDKVGAHQDSTFLYTDPPTCTGFWFALEPATKENGCMWAIPGSHLQYPITRRWVRKRDGSLGTEWTTPTNEYATQWEDAAQWVPLECPKGSLIVLHGALVHKSNENTSPMSRHAYTVHAIEGTAQYPADNWLQRPELPLTGFLEE